MNKHGSLRMSDLSRLMLPEVWLPACLNLEKGFGTEVPVMMQVKHLFSYSTEHELNAGAE
jgi:hypothetical protein